MKIHVTIVETKLLHGYCVPVDFCIIFGYFCDILKLYATYNFLTELGLYVSHVYLHVNLTDVSLITRNYLEFTCEPLEIAYFYIFCRIMPALCGHNAGIHAGIMPALYPHYAGIMRA